MSTPDIQRVARIIQVNSIDDIVMAKLGGATFVKMGRRNLPIEFTTQDLENNQQMLGSQIQVINYQEIKKRLAMIGLSFSFFGARTIQKYGQNKPSLTFVAFGGDFDNPSVLWHKHEGHSKGDGQNHIYIGKCKMQTAFFVRAEEKQILSLAKEYL